MLLDLRAVLDEVALLVALVADVIGRWHAYIA